MDKISSLDDLVMGLSESYNLSVSRTEKLKRGLESVVTEYLKNELSKPDSDEVAIIESVNPDEIIAELNRSGSVIVTQNGKRLCNLNNLSSGIRCNLLESVDIDKLNIDKYIDLWDTDESYVGELLSMLTNAVR